jgi:hypothetical protein
VNDAVSALARHRLARAGSELHVGDDALDGLKFSACLPKHLAALVLQRRADDPRGARWVLEQPVMTAIDVGGGS